MSIDPINIGGQANDGNGQSLRSGGALINANFAELDTRTATAQETAEQGVADAAAAQLKADEAIPASALGSTVAQLVAGTVPASQLPSFVDDVLEFASLAAFPDPGETGKIYIAINDGDNPSNPTRQYRWSGTAYVMIPSSPGSTDQVPEGSTNLYHTAARVRAVVLTGLGTLANTAITATDSILQAFAKLQGQINEKLGKTEKAADSDKLNGQSASFYTATMTGASSGANGAKGLVPAPQIADRDKYLKGDGTYGAPAGGGLPVGSPQAWYLPEASLPAGWIANNGQVLDRATWPDLWALFAPYAVTDAVWLASPYLNRGLPSSGNGTTTFRMPDTNGKHADGNTPGAAFLRGYGKNSAGTPGVFQLDQLQGHEHGATSASSNPFSLTAPSGTGPSVSGWYFTTGFAARTGPQVASSGIIADGTNGASRVGGETRSTNVTVIWCTVGAGAVINPGLVDVTALAGSVTAQGSRITDLETIFTLPYRDLTASRSAGTTYTSPGCFVSITAVNSGSAGAFGPTLTVVQGGNTTVHINGPAQTTGAGNMTSCIALWIPKGAQYTLTLANATLYRWNETRP